MDLGKDVVFCVSGDDKFLLDLSWRQLGALWLEPELLRRLVSSFLPLPLKAAEAKTQMTFRAWSFSLGDETQWSGEETSSIRVACCILTLVLKKAITLPYIVVFSEVIVDSLIARQEDTVLLELSSLFFRGWIQYPSVIVKDIVSTTLLALKHAETWLPGFTWHKEVWIYPSFSNTMQSEAHLVIVLSFSMILEAEVVLALPLCHADHLCWFVVVIRNVWTIKGNLMLTHGRAYKNCKSVVNVLILRAWKSIWNKLW